MFRVNLTDLEEAGSLRIQRSIVEDDPLWEGLDLSLGGPVDVDLEARATASGQVVVTGRFVGPFTRECRRCLDPVDATVEEELELLWSVPDELSEDAEDEAVRTLGVGTNELDLGPAIREEVALSAPLYVLCSEDCRGLCPRCGTNLNESECDCVLEEPDPRWEALRALKND